MTGAPLIVEVVTWFYLFYFVAINLFYFFLNVVSFVAIRRYVPWRTILALPRIYSGFEIPITILVPAHNERTTIADSVRSLLQLDYPEYEIVVVNDGSQDDTLAVLIEEFSLLPFPEATQERLETRPVRGIYRSKSHPNLRVVDKENGGKADALNAGINSARYPLFCCIDSDSMLQRNSLKQVVQPFLEDPNTIAAGGTVRIANGCRVEQGFLLGAALPRHYLGLMQIVEYLRAFLFGRMGWAPLNAVLIISGAFGLFRKETVVDSGGYRSDTVGEDMKLVIRLHRHMRFKRQPYRIAFVPDPICWTEAPQSLKILKNQRVRWQRGLCEALWLNKRLLFYPKGGAASWMAFPFMVFFEAMEPLVQASGYIITLVFFFMGVISIKALVSFVVIVVGLGILLSVNALMLEEISFHIYPGFRQSFVLLGSSFLENFGYRQVNTYWRLVGSLQWIFRTRARWGNMSRKGIGSSQALKSFLLVFPFLIVLGAPGTAFSSDEKPVTVRHWKARGYYTFQDLSFASNAQGGGFQLSYDEPKKWGVRGGFQYLDKFGDSAPGYRLGGTWWATRTTVLSLDAELAPKQNVVPRQAYTFEVGQVLWKVLVPSLGYRFADYTDVDSHTVMPALTWYFYPRFDWTARYYMSVSRFGGQNSVDHSAMTRFNWNPIDPLIVFAGYSRANESFESENPIAPVGGFSAHHVFGGGSWEFYKGLGVDFNLDYENRNNGTTVKTCEAAFFYKF